MNKKDFSNRLSDQAYKAAEIIREVCEKTDHELLKEVISMKEIHDIQKVIMTGCGDSWIAGIATRAVFEAVTGIDVEVMRNIDFTRHLNSRFLGYSPNTPLVIVVSASGDKARPTEALLRAGKYHANTIALTKSKDSPCGKAARHVFPLVLPPGNYNPGSNSYSAAVTSLIQLALRIGRARNVISHNEYEDMKKAIVDFADDFSNSLEALDDLSFDIATRWKDLRALDFIGDDSDYATAQFGSAKVLETYGGYTTYDDSEDWLHINYFLSEPETIGRVVIANKNTPSFSRIKETLESIKRIGSPCSVITDASADEFPDGIEVITTPEPRYFWLNPLLQHYIFDMIAGYIAELKGTPYFFEDKHELMQNTAAAHKPRLIDSKIEIV
ncbi:MAG: SIS domain-containing protein [Ruminococcaceae bacterium]|nr:SIS domain-containing protein [Oscillospiraceae bacterium]